MIDKKIISPSKLFSLLLLLVSFTNSANENISFGIGAGTNYTGLGANIGLKSPTDYKFISTGCLSYGSQSNLTCGVGVGWISTDLFEIQSKYHGLGLYIGAVNTEKNSSNTDEEAVYGGAITYNYFFNGISNPGANFGVALNAGDENDGVKFGVMLQIGYQF